MVGLSIEENILNFRWRRSDENRGDYCASAVGIYVCILRGELVASLLADAYAVGTGRAVHGGVLSISLGDDCGGSAGDRGAAIACESLCAAGVGAAGSGDCEHPGISFADES